MACEVCGFGSSPRPRGTLEARVAAVVGRRFIPAPAGNTAVTARAASIWTVHPRARGEHRAPRRPRARAGGSSPRPRGTRVCRGTRPRGGRFIPAPAGNTAWLASGSARSTVHPRARGEHVYQLFGRSGMGGSSPRPRGTPGAPHPSHARRRFIPAPAGNTTRFPPADVLCPVHPRARGEHRADTLAVLAYRGSSPRPRGTQYSTPRTRCGGRFIPAPAGNTPMVA